MDYKIKFEYKDAGKSVGKQRQSLLAAQKQQLSSQKQGGGSGLTQNKKMEDSFKKLIESNKRLEKALHRASGKGIGGGGGGVGDKAAGLGGLGASIPIAGVALGVAAFAISKINQVADAYLALGAQQKGSAGISGFRSSGKGMFTAAEIGGGMKSYGMKSGKFAAGRSSGKGSNFEAAIQMGNVFGISPEESMGQAGIMKRGGGDYAKSLYAGAGAGIETELPQFMSALAGELEEAVKNGVNSSDMAGDMGKELSSLTMATQTKSVDAALNIVRSFKGVKEQAARGQVGSYQNIMAWKAGQEEVTGKFKDEKTKAAYVKQLQDAGVISEEEAKGLSGLKKGAGMKDIQDIVGVGGTKVLTERAISQGGEAGMLRKTMQQQQKYYGKGAQGTRNAWNVYASQGGTMNQEQFFSAYQNAASELSPDQTAKGEKIIKGKSGQAMGTAAGLTSARENQRQALTLKYGEKFAETSMKFEESMMKLAEGAMPAANGALNGLTAAASGLSKAINKITKMMGVNTKSEEYYQNAKVTTPRG